MGGGGGGGGYFGRPVDPQALDSLRREAESRATAEGLEAEVNKYLKTVLATVHERDVVTVNNHLEKIKEALGKEVEGMENLLFGGSVAKRTYVDGLSDIDSLVLLKADSAENKIPRQLISEFCKALKDRLSPATIQTVEKGSLAVTVTFRDGTVIQLLPAYRARNNFAIADESGTGWRYINPKEFAQALSKANAKLGHQLVPIIKLAKIINDRLPEDRRLGSYHIEALAVEIFSKYRESRTFKTMLTHFFSTAAERVKRPIVDETGQSRHIDDELGPADSLGRLKAADSLARIARRMRNSIALEQWQSILEDRS